MKLKKYGIICLAVILSVAMILPSAMVSFGESTPKANEGTGVAKATIEKDNGEEETQDQVREYFIQIINEAKDTAKFDPKDPIDKEDYQDAERYFDKLEKPNREKLTADIYKKFIDLAGKFYDKPVLELRSYYDESYDRWLGILSKDKKNEKLKNDLEATRENLGDYYRRSMTPKKVISLYEKYASIADQIPEELLDNPDKSTLKVKIDELEEKLVGIKWGEKPGEYSPEIKEEADRNINKAKLVYGDRTASRNQVYEAISNLDDSIENLQPNEKSENDVPVIVKVRIEDADKTLLPPIEVNVTEPNLKGGVDYYKDVDFRKGNNAVAALAIIKALKDGLHLDVTDKSIVDLGSGANFMSKSSFGTLMKSDPIMYYIKGEEYASGINNQLIKNGDYLVIHGGFSEALFFETEEYNVKTGEEVTFKVMGSTEEPKEGAHLLVNDQKVTGEGTESGSDGVLKYTFNRPGTFHISTTGNGIGRAYAKVNVTGDPIGKYGNSYTVKFVDGDNYSKIEDKKVFYGEKAERPETPKRYGYNFKGWFKDKNFNEQWDFENAVTEDISLYAKWEKKKMHTLTFHSKPGEPQIAPAQVEDGGKLEDVGDIFNIRGKDVQWFWATPEREAHGYQEKYKVGYKEPIHSDKDIYLDWVNCWESKLEPYSIEGSPEMPESVKKKIRGKSERYKDLDGDGSITISQPDFGKIITEEGDWIVDHFDKDDFVVKADDKPTDEDLTFKVYMRFEPTYKVNLVLNGGAGDTSRLGMMRRFYGDRLHERDFSDTGITKKGYSLEGWYKDKELTDKWDFYDDYIKEDTTLYAKWIPATRRTARHTIKFLDIEGNKVAPNMKVYHGTLIDDGKFEKSIYPKIGFVPGYLYTDKDMTRQWSYSSDRVLDDMTLYLDWKSKITNVTMIIHLWVDNKIVGSIFTDYGQIPEELKAFRNYEYKGKKVKWYDTRYSNGTLSGEVDFLDFYNSVKPDYDKPNIRYIFGKAIDEKYKVNFNTDGGSSVDSLGDLEYNDELRNLPTPQKENYKFEGWFKDEDKKEPWTSSDRVKGNITLYAKWQGEKKLVSFESNGGTPTPNAVQTAVGMKLEEPMTPSKEGFVFLGWYQDSELTKPWDFRKDTIKDDMTLYAKWDKVKSITERSLLHSSIATSYGVDQGYLSGKIDFDIPDPMLKQLILKKYYFDQNNKLPINIKKSEFYASYLYFNGAIGNRPKIKDLKGIEYLYPEGLYINFYDTDIESLAPLSEIEKNYKRIKNDKNFHPRSIEITITDSKISDISPLGEIEGLEEVKLHGNQIETIPNLEKPKKLRVLDLSNNRIREASNIAKLDNLSRINLTNNHISEIPSLENLRDLTTLNLANNEIKDMSGISKNKQIGNLVLNNNKIEKLVGIENMRHLERISLGGNMIRDFSAFNEETIENMYTEYPHLLYGVQNIDLHVQKNEPFELVLKDMNGKLVSIASDKNNVKAGENGKFVYESEKSQENYMVWDDSGKIGWNITLYTGAEPVSKTEHTVLYKIGEGVEDASKKVVHERAADEPKLPEIKGKEFAGWYEDENYTKPWSINSPVMKDMTLYAKWSTNEYVVSFESNGGIPTPRGQVVQSYGKAKMPTEKPKREGYKFLGWFAEDSGGKQFDFDKAIEKDTKVFAHWKKEKADPADLTKLNEAIKKAKTAIKDVKTSKDGKDIAKTDKWVTSEAMKAMTDKIAEAEALVKAKPAEDKKTDVEKMTATLKKLTEEFKPAVGTKEEVKPTPSYADLTQLNKAIKNAKTAIKDVKSSKDGKDIAKTDKWVTSEAMKAMTDKIAEAEALVKAKPAEDKKADVEKMTAALKKLTEEFKPAAGTKEDVKPNPNPDPNPSPDPKPNPEEKAKLADATDLNKDNNLTKDNGAYVYTIGVSKGLSFRITGTNPDRLISVSIDDKVLVKDKDYTVVKGSILLNLRRETLDKLSVGRHYLTVKTKDGDVKTSFVVKEKTKDVGVNPNLNDNAGNKPSGKPVGSGNSDGNSNQSANKGGEATSTGDGAPIGEILTIMLLAGISTTIVIRKKKQIKH